MRRLSFRLFFYFWPSMMSVRADSPGNFRDIVWTVSTDKDLLFRISSQSEYSLNEKGMEL